MDLDISCGFLWILTQTKGHLTCDQTFSLFLAPGLSAQCQQGGVSVVTRKVVSQGSNGC